MKRLFLVITDEKREEFNEYLSVNNCCVDWETDDVIAVNEEDFEPVKMILNARGIQFSENGLNQKESIQQYLREIEYVLARNTKSQSDEFAQALRYCDCIREEIECDNKVSVWQESVVYTRPNRFIQLQDIYLGSEIYEDMKSLRLVNEAGEEICCECEEDEKREIITLRKTAEAGVYEAVVDTLKDIK